MPAALRGGNSLLSFTVSVLINKIMSENSELDVELHNTPAEVIHYANNNMSENLLPQKSRQDYEKIYALLRDWQQEKKTDSFSENVLVSFFGDLLKKWKSSTLWKIYSVLKATINVKHGIDISEYKKLKTLLKYSSENYVARKSKIFTEENVKQFLENAPDDIYLAIKVALIIGVIGACRKNELHNIKISDLKDLGSAILISIPNKKTKKPREFVITGDFYNIVKKYWTLRPYNVPSDSFFINFRKNKCTRRVIGVNKLGKMPRQIATFLNLDDPQEYTGHCFRRTSATTLVNADTIGPDIWKIGNENDKIEYSREYVAALEVREGHYKIIGAREKQELPGVAKKNIVSKARLQKQQLVQDGLRCPDPIFLSECSQPSTSGTQSVSEFELPHADSSQMVVEVNPETESSIVKIEPKLEDQEYYDYDTTASTLGHQEFESVDVGELDRTRTTQTAPGDAFCRLCLRQAKKDEVISLSLLDAGRSEKCAQMIKSLMPSFDFNLVRDPVMCHFCNMRLELACQFVEETLESQKSIATYRNLYAGNDEKVLCEDVIKYKSRSTYSSPPIKRKKLPDQSENHDLCHQTLVEVNSAQMGVRVDFTTPEELTDMNCQPLLIKEVEVKIDDEMLSAESDNFGQFETVILENTGDGDERLAAVKSEPHEENLDGPNQSGLVSDQRLETVPNLPGFSDYVSRTSNKSRSVLDSYSSSDSEGS